MKTFESKSEHFAWVQKKIAEKRDALITQHPEWDILDIYFDHSAEWNMTEAELNEMLIAEGYNPNNLFGKK